MFLCLFKHSGFSSWKTIVSKHNTAFVSPFFLESLERPFVKDEEEFLTQFITSSWQKVLTSLHKEEATCCVAAFTSQLFLSCNSKHAVWRLWCLY